MPPITYAGRRRQAGQHCFLAMMMIAEALPSQRRHAFAEAPRQAAESPRRGASRSRRQHTDEGFEGVSA